MVNGIEELAKVMAGAICIEYYFSGAGMSQKMLVIFDKAIDERGFSSFLFYEIAYFPENVSFAMKEHPVNSHGEVTFGTSYRKHTGRVIVH